MKWVDLTFLADLRFLRRCWLVLSSLQFLSSRKYGANFHSLSSSLRNRRRLAILYFDYLLGQGSCAWNSQLKIFKYVNPLQFIALQTTPMPRHDTGRNSTASSVGGFSSRSNEHLSTRMRSSSTDGSREPINMNINGKEVVSKAGRRIRWEEQNVIYAR